MRERVAIIVIILIFTSLFLNLKTAGGNAVSDCSAKSEIIRNSQSRAVIEKFGDWNVTGTEELENEIIHMYGNIRIESGGSLTLRNVSLKMQCDYDGMYNIEVESGGTFYIFDGDDNPFTENDRSNISGIKGDGSGNFYIWVKTGSIFEMRNSAIFESGYSHGSDFYTRGLFLESNNSIITGSYFSNSFNPLYINHAKNIHVNNCSFEGNTRGVIVLNSENVRFGKNVFKAGRYGIQAEYCNEIIVSECEFLDLYYGISHESCTNLSLNGNYLNENNFGLYLYESTAKKISNNTLEKNRYNIFLLNNEMPYDYNFDDTNLVNGAPIYLINNYTDVEISPETGFDEVGFLAVVNSDNIKINNISLTNNANGLLLFNSTNCTVEDIQLYDNDIGLEMIGSTNNEIKNSIIRNNNYGINLEQNSCKNEIRKCKLRLNLVDFFLIESSENIINNCELIDAIYSIYLTANSNQNIISKNEIRNATDVGIWIDDRTEENRLYLNNFLSNEYQAIDMSNKNYWDDGLALGNYWSDYEDKYPDAKKTGAVWNTPYELVGHYKEYDARDNFPLVNRVDIDIHNFYPVAIIESVSQETVPTGGVISFVGRGNDIDGFIAQYSWESDIDGFLSDLPYFTTSSLSRGNHTITFKVADDYRQWSLPKTKKIQVVSEIIYRPHKPITINSNDEFTKENGVLAGNGTEVSPYIIQGWEINVTAVNLSMAGITVTGTDAYFIISLCRLNGLIGNDTFINGVMFKKLTNARIQNCTIQNNGNGINILKSDNITIDYNDIHGSQENDAINVGNSENCVITGNLIYNNYLGIGLYESSKNTIEANLIYSNNVSMDLYTSYENLVRRNNVVKCQSFRVYKSWGNRIYGNNFVGYEQCRFSKESDSGLKNEWFDGNSTGNFWSCYNGSDDGSFGGISGDGVGDTGLPHRNVDYYPVMNPFGDFIEGILDNIEIRFYLDKNMYYSGEDISGKLEIRNNNLFNIFTGNTIQMSGSDIENESIIFGFTNSKGEKYFITASEDSIIIKPGAIHTINFTHDGTFIPAGKTGKLWEVKTLAGSYFVNSNFGLFIENNFGFDINITSNEILQIIDRPMLVNVSVGLTLDKQEFYENEPISGILTVYNNNPRPVALTYNPLSCVARVHFSFRCLDTNESGWGINKYDLNPIVVEANSIKNIEILVTGLFSRNLSAGNYSIRSWFYCVEAEFMYNLSFFVETGKTILLESNEVEFIIHKGTFSGLENAALELVISKPEFDLTECISGWVTITNNNRFDIELGLPRESTIRYFILREENCGDYYTGSPEEPLFPLKVSAGESRTLRFNLSSFTDFPGLSIRCNYSKLSLGFYSMSFYFTLGNQTHYILSKSNSVNFTINELSTEEVGQDEDGSAELSESIYSSVLCPVIAILVIFTTFSTIFVVRTGYGRYRFFALVDPLFGFGRKTRDEASKQITLGIRNHILANPGLSYVGLKKFSKLSDLKLIHILISLENQGLIIPQRHGAHQLFETAVGKLPENIFEMDNRFLELILAIKVKPGISKRELLYSSELPARDLNSLLETLVGERLIKIEYEGKASKCYVLEKNLEKWSNNRKWGNIKIIENMTGEVA